MKKLIAATALTGMFALGSWVVAEAGGETRTISLYHIHTGESLTVAYMVDGRYVPSAMRQINYLLRDWRRNKTVTIDPRTIDLVWELHADLGSKEAIKVVCGYRSAQTNALLHRIGRHVAEKSQHINGKAIDFYFPDVPTVKIRNSALVRDVGGVGYYRSAGGPTGFLHVDSGHVRHWGPYISDSQMASIEREGRKTLGRRLKGRFSTDTQVASASSGSGGGLLSFLGFGKKKAPTIVADEAPTQVAMAEPVPPAPVTPKAKGISKTEAAYAAADPDLADLANDAAVAPAPAKVKVATPVVSAVQQASLGDLSQDAAQAPTPVAPKVLAAKPQALPVAVADASLDDASNIKRGTPVPKPRLKPVEVMLMAAANIKADPNLIRITAASAPPPNLTGKDEPSPVSDSLGTIMQAAAEDATLAPKAVKAKTHISALVKPMVASAGGSDINWWPQQQLNNKTAASALSSSSGIENLSASPINPAMQHSAPGKEDQLTVVRDGKGDLDENASSANLKLQKVGELVIQ